MKNLLKILSVFSISNTRKESDFSDFFAKPAGEKKKVISQVLREANEEQSKMVKEYRNQPTNV